MLDCFPKIALSTSLHITSSLPSLLLFFIYNLVTRREFHVHGANRAQLVQCPINLHKVSLQKKSNVQLKFEMLNKSYDKLMTS